MMVKVKCQGMSLPAGGELVLAAAGDPSVGSSPAGLAGAASAGWLCTPGSEEADSAPDKPAAL